MRATSESESIMSQMRINIWMPSIILWPLCKPVMTLPKDFRMVVAWHSYLRVTCI